MVYSDVACDCCVVIRMCAAVRVVYARTPHPCEHALLRALPLPQSPDPCFVASYLVPQYHPYHPAWVSSSHITPPTIVTISHAAFMRVLCIASSSVAAKEIEALAAAAMSDSSDSDTDAQDAAALGADGRTYYAVPDSVRWLLLEST